MVAAGGKSACGVRWDDFGIRCWGGVPGHGAHRRVLGRLRRVRSRLRSRHRQPRALPGQRRRRSGDRAAGSVRQRVRGCWTKLRCRNDAALGRVRRRVGRGHHACALRGSDGVGDDSARRSAGETTTTASRAAQEWPGVRGRRRRHASRAASLPALSLGAGVVHGAHRLLDQRWPASIGEGRPPKGRESETLEASLDPQPLRNPLRPDHPIDLFVRVIDPPLAEALWTPRALVPRTLRDRADFGEWVRTIP
jgi:hypothetical protein